MKKLIVLIMGVLLLVSVGFAMSAQEAPPGLDEETVRQAAVMDTPAGAEMRLMQLESAKSRNVILGQKAIETVLEKNPEANTTELERIVAELETIREEIEEKLESEVLYDKNQTALVEEFLTLKEEGKNLSKEFREKVHEYLNEEEKQQIRKEARQRADEELDEKRQRIKERTREHNAEQVEHVLQRIGTENESLVEKVRDGEINTGEAISQVAKKFRGLGEERRQDTKVQIKSERAQRHANSQDAVEKGKQGLNNRTNKRANERLEEVREKLEHVREKVKENVPEHVKEKISKRMGPPKEVPRGPQFDEEDEEKETEDEVSSKYNLALETVGEGNTTPEAGNHSYEEGEEVEVNATPEDGWEFEGFSRDCSGLECELIMESEKEITATFVEKDDEDEDKEAINEDNENTSEDDSGGEDEG
ncbi:MAG: InlB B-repeat-containing protein [Candidatus Nanoarchaeia archaeon]